MREKQAGQGALQNFVSHGFIITGKVGAGRGPPSPSLLGRPHTSTVSSSSSGKGYFLSPGQAWTAVAYGCARSEKHAHTPEGWRPPRVSVECHPLLMRFLSPVCRGAYPRNR